MDILRQYPKPHPQTAGRVIDGEAILTLADSSEVNVLNRVGSRVFQLADGSRTIAEIAAIIAAEWGVTPTIAEQDTVEFLTHLAGRDVFVLSDTREE